MKDNQYNDNLERFFKANLENYSPVPSSDFWLRMEPAIPPKVSYWSGWKSIMGKWIGIALLIGAIAVIFWCWQKDRTQIARLTKTVAQQQQQLDRLDGRTEEAPSATTTKPITEQAVSMLPAQSVLVPQAVTEEPWHTQTIGKKSIKRRRLSSSSSKKADYTTSVGGNKNGLEEFSIANRLQVVEEFADDSKNQIEVASMANSTGIQVSNSESLPNSILLTPAPIAARNTRVFSKSYPPLAIKHIAIRPQRAFPRFSIEAGGKAYRMPLGRLFQQDTFLTGRTGLSYSSGFKINYELNSRLAFQVGYQFTNLRARRLALRYNSFPVAVQKCWNWAHRSHLEASLGISLNSLVSARTASDGQSVKGLKTTWVGFQTGVAASWSLTEKLTLVAGPSAGFSITPMTTGRRTWDVGVGASLRYQL